MTRKRPLVVLALLASMLLGVMRPANAIFDKVRFATDLGVAFFAFHHWVQKPYKNGEFSAGAPHRTKALVKGGVALLFAVNRLKAANKIAHTSSSPTLQKIGGGIDKLEGSFLAVGNRLKGGNFKPDEINGIDGNINNVTSGASSGGINIKDVPISIPGT